MCTARGTLSDLIVDEIALEGLEGITLQSLWVYIGNELEIPLPLPPNLVAETWDFIRRVAKKRFTFYKLPKERDTIKLFQRFSNLDGEYGVPVVTPECPFPRYKFKPLQDGEIIGSCECYKERKEIKLKELAELSVQQVVERWGQKFIIVASQELRWNALVPINRIRPTDLFPQQYSILEIIGRARCNGESIAGKWSLQQFINDSSLLCIIKQKLLRYGVIKSQRFNEIQLNKRLGYTTLLSLPRFFITSKSVLVQVIEQLFSILKTMPDYRLSAIEARDLITQDRVKSFKKISSTTQFRQIFETQNMLYSSKLHPNEKKSERKSVVITIRNPQLNVEELFPKDADEDDNLDNSNDDFWTYDNVFVDMPMRSEIYRAIKEHGARGVANSELCEYMAISQLSMRQILKKFIDLGLVKTYVKDMGRQRAKMYVAIENMKLIKDIGSDKNLQCDPEPNLPETGDQIMQDIEDVTATIRYAELDAHIIAKETLTERLINRKAIIVRVLNEKCIINLAELRNIIHAEEKQMGYNDELCQKSIRRLLYHMEKDQILNWYELTLIYDGQTRYYRYVTHPKIMIDHPIIKHEIIKLKNSIYLISEEKREKERTREKTQQNKMIKAAEVRAKILKQMPAAPSSENNIKQEPETTATSTEIGNVKTEAAQKVIKLPKFLVSRYLHEILCFLAHEQSRSSTKPVKITEALLQHWQLSEPDLNIREYYDECHSDSKKIVAYSHEINWRTFIPPIPKYENKPPGWLYLLDVLDRVPLCILNKIFRLDKKSNDELQSYIGHPVRQHYISRHLRKGLLSGIVSRIEMQKTLLTIVKLLNNMGLLQLGERQQVRDPLVLWVYVNKHTKILDTTTTEAGYAVVNRDRKYNVQHYVLDSGEDVTSFWSNLQRISIYTKLGFQRGKSKPMARSLRELRFLDPVSYQEAPSLDIGDVPGDGLGAGGLGSNLFAHIFRNWFWVVQTSTKPVKPGRPGRLPNLRSKTKLQLNGRKSRLHMPPIQVKRLKATGKTSLTKTQSHTAGTSKILKSKETNYKKSGPRDAIDRDALNNMRTLRVQWSSEEDDILKISRTVYLYVAAPVIALGLLTVGKLVRDLLRHSLGIKNKTSQACVRRCQFLVKMQRDMPEVPSWLHILQTNEYMQQRYGDDFLKRLKSEYANRKDYCDALLVHFIKIMQFLYELIYCKSVDASRISRKTKFLLPDTLAEVQRLFHERPVTTDEVSILHKNPTTEQEQQIAVVYSVLHANLCSARDKTLYNLQAFEIYKTYSEDVLHSAFTKARNDSLAVLVKRKNLQLAPTQLAGPHYLLSSKYRMRLMFLKIPYQVYDLFYAYYCEVLRKFFGEEKPKEKEKDLKAHKGKYFELKSPQVGQLIVIAEGLLQTHWQINIKFPINILTIDVEQSPKGSHIDRILDHYSTIFENAPTTEYDKQIPVETNERDSIVKFHPAHLTYKLLYPAYDTISKLRDSHLHFFCALDSLQQQLHISCASLLQIDPESGVQQVVCPFARCVLDSPTNYIDEIERIVCERKANIFELHTLATIKQQKLRPLGAENPSFETKLQNTNVLAVMEMLEDYWRLQQREMERKDLGKSPPPSKPIDWLRLCKSLTDSNVDDDNERGDEYEPTFHKEERALRAQDVFVVNLPTLQFYSTERFKTCTDMVKFKDINVPRKMVDPDLQRAEILEKVLNESYWKYTDNTLETLKPEMRALKWNKTQEKFLINVHNYIESHKIGVTTEDLMHTFKNLSLLQRSLQLLSAHQLIKRVGVATVMYVHKNHIRPWVIHTFHIKRLEREKISAGGGAQSVKRKASSLDLTSIAEVELAEPQEEAPTCSKRLKLDEMSNEIDEIASKRIRKRTVRFEIDEPEATKKDNDVTRDIIVMKPHPWLRLNGSLNRRVFDRWLGSVLCECIARTGCFITEICQRFPHMLPVDIMFLLEILGDLKCIQLIQIESAEVDLLSDYQPIKETCVTDLYNPVDTYIKPLPNALSRLAIFIGDKKYAQDFI